MKIDILYTVRKSPLLKEYLKLNLLPHNFIDDKIIGSKMRGKALFVETLS